MSLQTIVSDGVVGRFYPRETRAAVARPRVTEMAVLLSGASMRVLETGLAVASIAVALLLGLAR